LSIPLSPSLSHILISLHTNLSFLDDVGLSFIFLSSCFGFGFVLVEVLCFLFGGGPLGESWKSSTKYIKWIIIFGWLQREGGSIFCGAH
jgi:hypothetical protein